MRKNLLKSILFLVLSFLMAVFFAGCDCKGCKSCNEGEGPTISVIDLYFSSDEINLTIDDSRRLDVFVDGVMQNPADVKFSSENPNVVAINDAGEVTGYAPGSTYVNATLQGTTAKCMVNVDLMGLAPEIVFVNADYAKYDKIAIPLGDKLDMAANISFNGKIFHDAEFSYELSDETLGTVSGTEFSSDKVEGELQISVVAKWRGVNVEEKVIKVALTNSLSILVNGDPHTTIPTTAVVLDKAGAITTNTFDFEVVVTDRISDEPLPIIVELDKEYEDIISYDSSNNKIVVKEMGTAFVDVYSKVDGSKGPLLRSVKIVVNPYIFENEKADQIYLFDAADGIFDVESIFGANTNTKIAGAEFIDRDYLKLSADEDGKVLGITTDGDVEPTAEYVTVYNKQYGYRIQVKAYGKIVDTPEDLLWFNFSTDGNNYSSSKMNVKSLDGYYIMTKDIDMSNVDFATIPQMNYTGWQNEAGEGKIATLGLKGTFDGQGYSIYNMKGMVGGIFGILNGTVKNLAFRNVNLEKVVDAKGAEMTVSLLASRIFNASKLENIYIDVPTVDSTNYGVLSNVVSSDINAKNLVIILNTDKITSNCSPISSRAVRAAVGNGYSQGSDNPFNKMQNVIIVTGIPLGTVVNNASHADGSGIYRMDAANVTNLDIEVPFSFLDEEHKVLNYTAIKNSTLYRFNNFEELAKNKNAISGILDKFREEDSWLITDEDNIFWAKGESICVNGEKGVKEINLYLENDYGFFTQAVVNFVKDGVDYSKNLEATTSVEGIVLADGNVITANAVGDVEVTVAGQGATITFVIHVKEALDSAKLFVNLRGEKATAEYDNNIINLYYQEGEDVSDKYNTFFNVVLELEGWSFVEGFNVSIKEGSGVSVNGATVVAVGEGDSVVLVDCGRGKTFEIRIKTRLVFNADDLTGSEDFPAGWLSGLGK